jgi:hypothetical protein
MITKHAMVVLAEYPEESKEKEKKKPSLLRRMTPGIGAFSTSIAGNVIRSKKLIDALEELYPGITAGHQMNADTLANSHKTLHDTYNQLKNDDTRMGKINYFIAKQLLKRPAKSVQSSLDFLKNTKADKATYDDLMNAGMKYFMGTPEMYSIMKNPKLNALAYGMSKAFPLYAKYLLAKHLYRYGKKGFNMLKNKINSKKDQPMLPTETESSNQ